MAYQLLALRPASMESSWTNQQSRSSAARPLWSWRRSPRRFARQSRVHVSEVCWRRQRDRPFAELAQV